MERATVRFYEQQGLISPRRRENGYREYSQEDVQQLLRIKLLRALGVSLEEIGEIQAGARSLPQALRENAYRLDSREQALIRAREVCRSIEEAGVSFAALDAPRYLAQLEEPEETLRKETGRLQCFLPHGGIWPGGWTPESVRCPGNCC